MNKNSRKMLPAVLAVMLLMVVFAAMCAPASASEIQLKKDTIPPTGLEYSVGDIITYELKVTNPSELYSCTVDVYDKYPNGTELLVDADLTLGIGEFETYQVTYVVAAEDVVDGKVKNILRVEGINSAIPPEDVDGAVTKTNLIPSECEFAFMCEQSCCKKIEFTGAAGGNITNHTWTFGDGNTLYREGNPGDFPPFDYIYTSCGDKLVKLSGWCENGYTTYNETSGWVYVDCGPTARATAHPERFCGTETVTFDGSGSYADPSGTNSIVSYDWEFSDATSDSGAVVTKTVTLAEGEILTATLTVNDSHCEDSDDVDVKCSGGCSIRLYGTYGEGAGNLSAIDPETGLAPENKPYSDPEGPFFPQHNESPNKDFMTFNPAIMDHNDEDFDYSMLSFKLCNDTDIQQEKEKVFKRMWYEKDWYKDHDKDGCWDVVVEKWNPVTKEWKYDGTMCLRDWNAMPEWQKVRDGLRLREHNNDQTLNDSNVDIYAPSILQDFTYMFTDEETMPIMIQNGSRVLIPMASREPNNGIDSFDAMLGDGVTRDHVMVESEATLGMDIDGDGRIEPMDGNGIELSGDETLVLVLPEKNMEIGDEIQFFDHKVELLGVYGPDNRRARFLVSDNEEGGSTRSTTVTMGEETVRFFYRAEETSPGQTFYLRLVTTNWPDGPVVVEVGRMFGQTYANIGANVYWSQKAFMVDCVLYNVVAIKAQNDCVKYITIRQKLPKEDIKLYGKHLCVWDPRDILPELPPFNEDHKVLVDVLDYQFIPQSMQDKIGDMEERPPLEIFYVNESIEPRYTGSLLEIYNETRTCHEEIEKWVLEWFHTYPEQYTSFKLPPEVRVLVTLSWFAPEAETTIWNANPDEPLANYTGDRVKFWYEDCTGPLYIDRANESIRVYGTYGEGAGDQSARDPEPGPSYNLTPENKPYTDPEGPFFPQHNQSPRKDFVTFNPAIMDHNQGYPELSFKLCNDTDIQQEKEKVFKRMWYEKDWFKDHDKDGCWDVVVEKWNPVTKEWKYDGTMCLKAWNAIPEWQKVRDGLRLREWNNDQTLNDSNVDIYAPSIIQDFTYMFTDEETMPIMIQNGSRVLIPMASHVPDNGIDSFDAMLGDGVARDYVFVESETTLGMDIDHDGLPLEPMDPDTIELNGNEALVLVLPEKHMEIGNEIQFFDHKVELLDVYGPDARQARFLVSDNEEGGSTRDTTVTLNEGDVRYFYRAEETSPGQTFYLRLVVTNWGTTPAAVVEVGRMFGQTHANIGANPYWSQKAFMVDCVLYNVVAIKAQNDCVKYITIRQKLPKFPIKLYGKHLCVWGPGVTLPELPPFNEDHEVLVDILPTQFIPQSMQEKIGVKVPRPALNITYTEEDIEERFTGSLLEIYNETKTCDEEIEKWVLEWFHTYPEQYTAFTLPEGELYLMTLAWYAPEAETTIWNCDPDKPLANYTGDRAKFWYDPADPTDIYINKMGDGGVGDPDDWNEWDNDCVIADTEISLAEYHWATNTEINGHVITDGEISLLEYQWATGDVC